MFLCWRSARLFSPYNCFIWWYILGSVYWNHRNMAVWSCFFAHVHLKEACQQKLTGARRASRGESHSPTRLYIRSGSKTMVSDASGSHGLFALWGGNLSATLKTEKWWTGRCEVREKTLWSRYIKPTAKLFWHGLMPVTGSRGVNCCYCSLAMSST